MVFEPESSASSRSFADRRRDTRRQGDRRLLRRDRELEAARRMSEVLFQHLATCEVMVTALQTTLDVIGAESGSILLAEPESRQLVFRHSIGANPVPSGTAIPWDQGIAGEVFHSGKPIVIRDAKSDVRHFPGIDEMTQHVTRDMIALPLKRWEGDPIGVLEVLNKRDGLLDEDDLAILTIVSAIAATAIEQARLFQEAKLAEVVRLLGDISHDIKNMLMPVVCGTGLLESEIKDLLGRAEISPQKAKSSFELCTEVIGMVQSSTRRIQDHVKEIADCVKGLSSPPQFAPCRVGSVVESVFETLRWLADEKSIALRSQNLDRLPVVMADERRLFNAFYNLVNNAIPEVSPGGSVTISGQEEPATKSMLIAVADTGRGMPPELRDSLFTARVKSTKPGGTGLGTKIVKDVVDAHGGTITVESVPGAGTTFRIRFPLGPAVS